MYKHTSSEFDKVLRKNLNILALQEIKNAN